MIRVSATTVVRAVIVVSVCAGIAGCGEATRGWAGFNSCLDDNGYGTRNGGTLDLADHAKKHESIGKSGTYKGNSVAGVDLDPNAAVASKDATYYADHTSAATLEQVGPYLIQWTNASVAQERIDIRACAKQAT